MIKLVLKRIFQLLLIVFIVIQFFRPEKNISAEINSNDITTVYQMPEDVKTILKTSCYDCHSNNTIYPWYAEVQPVAWWLNEHIKDAKKDLNFSEFGTYRIRRKFRKLEEINDLVKKAEMPLKSYLILHGDAKLTDQQIVALTKWTNEVRDTIKATYPVDSLVRKK